MKELTFKIAQRQDSPLILEYIKKLAEYEKRLDEVIATTEDMNLKVNLLKFPKIFF